MRPSLPDFADPPVVEVALSVQFETIEALRSPQMGLLWSEFRDRFPKTEEHLPLGAVFERFGVPAGRKGAVRLEVTTTPPVARCWFLNEPGTELIQVQQDRFIHNWRKVGEGDQYPRHEQVCSRFREELATFRTFLAREQLGELVPNQCELTYVNHIVAGQGWERHGQLGEVLTAFRPEYSDAFLSEPEDARVAIRYIIPDEAGEPLGRLHVTVEPVYQHDDAQPMFLMKLTARGRPDGEGDEGVFRFLDTGREWIVRGFTSITTPALHGIWRRQHDR